MRFKLALLLALTIPAWPQASLSRLRAILEASLITPEVVHFQLQKYLEPKVPALPKPGSGAEWTAQSQKLRREILQDVIYHGWPKEWVEAPLKVEDLGLVSGTGEGYRIRKLRYEIVPGMWGSALLYEPAQKNGKAPGIVNLNGHVGPPGKAIEYKQKRCINQALQGIYSLNLEWFSYGDLSDPGNVHWNAAQLDLTGANAAGIFYLAMRKGLDYLEKHPDVDPKRLGVTGLSGGGWQTIILSALDERVSVSVPVAGYSALTARLERAPDVGDIEQNATDLLVGRDYPHFTAMRAPKPTLLQYNAEDDCCFRAPLVKDEIYDRVRPFYGLYNAGANFAWHENRDPGDHNYQLDNRQHGYAFFTRHFGLSVVEKEKLVAGEIRSPEELRVELPADNLSLLTLAGKLASMTGSRSGTREKLREILRYKPVTVTHAWAAGSTKNREIETRSYRFDFQDGLSATGVWAKAIEADDNAPATILLHDEGRAQMAAAAVERLDRGGRVLVADLLFTGDMVPKPTGQLGFAQMIAATGSRPLGLRVAQLTALARWLGGKPAVIATGPRSGVVALAAAAAEPGLFGGVSVEGGLQSFAEIQRKPVQYTAAPELFCLDLYKYFDIAGLQSLAQPAAASGNK